MTINSCVMLLRLNDHMALSVINRGHNFRATFVSDISEESISRLALLKRPWGILVRVNIERLSNMTTPLIVCYIQDPNLPGVTDSKSSVSLKGMMPLRRSSCSHFFKKRTAPVRREQNLLRPGPGAQAPGWP